MFQSQWNNLELPESRRASNSCELNETPPALLINLRVRVGDRLQVFVCLNHPRSSLSCQQTRCCSFRYKRVWCDASWGTQTVQETLSAICPKSERLTFKSGWKLRPSSAYTPSRPSLSSLERPLQVSKTS